MCVSRFPELLGGISGNQIVGCSPTYSFKDMLLGKIYTEIVPSTLVIGDLNAKLENGDYRFVCNYDSLYMTAEKLPTLGNRFTLLYNVCNFFDVGGFMENYSCNCSSASENDSITKSIVFDNDGEKEKTMKLGCSLCTSGYGVSRTGFTDNVIGYNHGVSVGINAVDPSTIEFYKTTNSELNGLLPVGKNILLRMRNGEIKENYSCMRTLLPVTNTYTPELLQVISGI